MIRIFEDRLNRLKDNTLNPHQNPKQENVSVKYPVRPTFGSKYTMKEGLPLRV